MDPSKRLGSTSSGGYQQLKRHPFFDGVHWDAVWQVDGPPLVRPVPSSSQPPDSSSSADVASGEWSAVHLGGSFAEGGEEGEWKELTEGGARAIGAGSGDGRADGVSDSIRHLLASGLSRRLGSNEKTAADGPPDGKQEATTSSEQHQLQPAPHAAASVDVQVASKGFAGQRMNQSATTNGRNERRAMAAAGGSSSSGISGSGGAGGTGNSGGAIAAEQGSSRSSLSTGEPARTNGSAHNHGSAGGKLGAEASKGSDSPVTTGSNGRRKGTAGFYPEHTAMTPAHPPSSSPPTSPDQRSEKSRITEILTQVTKDARDRKLTPGWFWEPSLIEECSEGDGREVPSLHVVGSKRNFRASSTLSDVENDGGPGKDVEAVGESSRFGGRKVQGSFQVLLQWLNPLLVVSWLVGAVVSVVVSLLGGGRGKGRYE